MQMVSEIMTREVMFVSPQESVQMAAKMMNDMNVGALPVCDGDRLVGMITDRDITVRSVAEGKSPGESRVAEAMSGDVRWCFEDQSVDEVMQQMGDSRIRRVPVVSHDEAHRLVGIVALGDLATRTDEPKKQEVEKVVEKVSSPSQPDLSLQGGSPAQPGAAASAAADTGGSQSIGAPGATAGDKDTIGSRVDDDVTGAGRHGRVGFAGDPGGLSPAEIEESQAKHDTNQAGGSTGAPDVTGITGGGADTAGGGAKT